MNLKLYGICFKMRGGPDLLDYVQSKENIPVDVMEQVMSQMDSVTDEEMAFAKLLDSDWKKAFNERVPLLMRTRPDGGYDISCEVPDELLDTIRLLTGKDDAKIVEEFTADHLKNVCGIDTDIQSVDMTDVEMPVTIEAAPAPEQGVDLSALMDGPEEPAFEDVSGFNFEEPDMETEIPVPAVETTDRAVPETALLAADEPEPEYEEPDDEEGAPVYEDEDIPDEDYQDEDPFDEEEEEAYGDVPPYGVEEDVPEDVPEEEAEEQDLEEDSSTEALKTVYKDLVGNIRDKKLDERLGIKIGG